MTFNPVGSPLLTGILLAGGNSTRFGSDKGLAFFKGRTLIERSAEVLAPFCGEVLISSGNPGHRRFGYRVVPDLVEDSGPLMGLFSSLQASRSSLNLVMAVDNVLIEGSYYAYLLETSYRMYDAAVPFLEGRYFEPLAGFYSKSILPAMSAMIRSGNFRLPDLLRQSKVLRLDVERDFKGYNPNYFRSANTGDELAAIGKP